MELKFKKSIYTVTQIISAAYIFTEQAYIYLDDDDEFVYVKMQPKKGFDISEIQGELKNEVLAQVLRESIQKRTHNVRNLIFQRAMSSSMIVSNNFFSERDVTEQNDYDLEPILKDWFAGENKKK